MTNPDNAIGTNAAYGGRTSANAFNDGLASFGRGILNGWACLPSSGLKVTIGGQSGVRDVAIAQDDNGNNTTINNISGSPIEVTIGAAPGTNSRIDSIVAYVDNPPEGADTEADNPDACGLIVVPGTVSSSPSAPNNSTIRSAITADGGAGATAYYVVLANVLMASGTTDITSNLISSGGNAQLDGNNIDFTKISASGVLRLGGIKVMWGSGTVYNVPTDTERTTTVTFPESFNTVPKMVVSGDGWLAWRMCITNSITETRAGVIVRHAQGTTLNTPFNWIAIG